jgi:rubrerythrin
MKLRTKTNLTMAMQSGALDAARYPHFAACARMDGDWDLANAFEDPANTDHTRQFSNETEILGLIGQSSENLRTAIDAEAREMHMFAQFAREAIEDGDVNAAALFNRISRDKGESCSRLKNMLAKIGARCTPLPVASRS